jgi:hypothetical protein
LKLKTFEEEMTNTNKDALDKLQQTVECLQLMLEDRVANLNSVLLTRIEVLEANIIRQMASLPEKNSFTRLLAREQADSEEQVVEKAPSYKEAVAVSCRPQSYNCDFKITLDNDLLISNHPLERICSADDETVQNMDRPSSESKLDVPISYPSFPELSSTHCSQQPRANTAATLERQQKNATPRLYVRRHSSSESHSLTQTSRASLDGLLFPGSSHSTPGGRNAPDTGLLDMAAGVRRESRPSVDRQSFDRQGGEKLSGEKIGGEKLSGEMMSFDSRRRHSPMRQSFDIPRRSLDSRRPDPAASATAESPLARREQLSVLASVLGHLQAI